MRYSDNNDPTLDYTGYAVHATRWFRGRAWAATGIFELPLNKAHRLRKEREARLKPTAERRAWKRNGLGFFYDEKGFATSVVLVLAVIVGLMS